MLYIGLILSYHKSGFAALSQEQTLLFVIRGYYTITCGVFNTCLEKIMKRNENVLALAKRKMRVGSFAPGGAGYKTVKIIFIVRCYRKFGSYVRIFGTFDVVNGRRL